LDFVVPPIDALSSYIGSSAKITTSLSNNVDKGVAAARNKDMAIVFVNA
jgi:beta-glucosidase